MNGPDAKPWFGPGAKPWVAAYYFHGGDKRVLVYAPTAAEARTKAKETLPAVHSIRRATDEQVAELLAPPPSAEPPSRHDAYRTEVRETLRMMGDAALAHQAAVGSPGGIDREEINAEIVRRRARA